MIYFTKLQGIDIDCTPGNIFLGNGAEYLGKVNFSEDGDCHAK